MDASCYDVSPYFGYRELGASICWLCYDLVPWSSGGNSVLVSWPKGMPRVQERHLCSVGTLEIILGGVYSLGSTWLLG